jgi:hypothetical protein
VEEETIVVVDSSKLNQLARFCVSCRGEIKEVFLKGKLKGWRFVSTTTNVRRALQSFIRELEKKGKKDVIGEVAKLYVKEVELLLDKVIPKRFYLCEVFAADEVLFDSDFEKEDAQALALAIVLVKEGFEVLLWTNDKDFLGKSEEIERRFGVKVVKILKFV